MCADGSRPVLNCLILIAMLAPIGGGASTYLEADTGGAARLVEAVADAKTDDERDSALDAAYAYSEGVVGACVEAIDRVPAPARIHLIHLIGMFRGSARASVSKLVALARGGDGLERVEAVAALRNCADLDDASYSAVLDLLLDPEKSVRSAAAATIYEIGRRDAKTHERLEKLAKSGARLERSMAVRAGLRIWPESEWAIGLLRELLLDDDESMRCVGCEIAGGSTCCPPVVIPQLIRLLGAESSPRVLVAALDCAKGYGRLARRLRGVVTERTKSENGTVRAHALAALEAI